MAGAGVYESMRLIYSRMAKHSFSAEQRDWVASYVCAIHALWITYHRSKLFMLFYFCRENYIASQYASAWNTTNDVDAYRMPHMERYLCMYTPFNQPIHKRSIDQERF